MVEEGAEGAREAGLPADWAVGIARGGGVWRGKRRRGFETVCLFIGLRSGRKGACLPKATSGLLLHAVLEAARGARWRTAGAAAYPTAKTTPGKPSYLGLYHASPLERISLIKEGVPASDVKLLLADLHIAQGVGFRALNLATATVNKKAKSDEVLSAEESERVIGLAKLVGQLEAMVEESGDPSGFDARSWIARWLTEPLPAFGGARPVDLIDTMEGQGLVSSALAKLQSGAYA